MTNLTSQQQTALDFFSLYEDQVKYFGLTIFAEREERRLYNQGKKILNEVLALKSKGSRIDYTQTEVEFLCSTYVNTGSDMKETQRLFFVSYPSTTHSASSVWMKISRIRTLDSLFDNDTEWQVDQQVFNILQTIDSNRFGSVSEMKKLSLEAQAEKILSDLLG